METNQVITHLSALLYELPAFLFQDPGKQLNNWEIIQNLLGALIIQDLIEKQRVNNS